MERLAWMCRAVCATGLLLSMAAGEGRAQVVLSPIRYELSFEVDYAAEMLRGTTRIVVENPSTQPVRQASLLLYRLLRVTDARDDQGSKLDFSQAVVAFEDFRQLQVNQVLVTLREPLEPRARTTVELKYEGYLLGYAETGMRYVQDRIDPEFTILRDDSYAYPQPGYPSIAVNRSAPEWKFSYSARITVPRGLTVANGGRLEGKDSSGDRVTYRFSSLKPSWRMDFAIAKYGELASDLVQVYYLPGDSLGAEGVAEAAKRSLSLFTEWFGPLHDATGLTFIEVPDGWGSQADITAVIQSAAAFRDPKQHREVYHEISHLWNVSPTDRPAPRWDEGLATFLEYLVHQEVTGEAVIDARAEQLIKWFRDTLPTRPEWRKVPLIDYGRTGMTDLSYWVGALFFDLLYRLVGREAFNEIVRSYAAEFGARGGSTKDLGDVILKTAGKAQAPLINDWLFATAWTSRIEQNTGIEALVAYYRGGAHDKGR